MKKLFFAVCVLMAHTAFGQELSESEKEILMLQDQRSLGNGKLVAYLSSPDERLRYRAAIALANLQDTTTVDALIEGLRDAAPAVRSAAAFALGQIGSARAEDSLISALKREMHAETFGRVAEALGKCGTEEALLALVEHKLDSKVESVRGQLVLAVSRFALRQIKTERAVWFCFDQLASNDASVRWSALFALWRAAPLRVIDIELAKRTTELQKLVNDPSPDVRMQFATLLGRVKIDESTGLLKQLSTAEWKRNEWRVQVNIVRSLGALLPEEPELLPDFLAYLASSNDHVVVTALQVTATLAPAMISGSTGEDKLQADLVALTNAQTRADMVRGEALVVLGRHFPDKVNAGLLTKTGSSPRLKSKVIEAVSFKPSVENFRLLTQYLEDDSVRVAMAAWDFFRRVASPFAIAEYIKQDTTLTNVQQVIYGKIRSALDRNDMAITTLVANAVGDTTFFVFFKDTEFEEQVRQQLVAAYQRLSSPDDTETMQAVLNALGRIGNQAHVPLLERALQDPDRTVALFAAAALQRITGKDYSSQVPQSTKPMYTDYDWKALDELSDDSRLVLKTSKGTVTLALLKDHAPFTVLNIVKLARKGFYNGLNFHRVVPNFVIQGGDPRGDGWGGPGYAIRSEFSLINYERGMVGIASAGKDTEGCQFFVAHSPQPHLDGRYTIFAKVLEGMDVVDTIQVGDEILEIEVDD